MPLSEEEIIARAAAGDAAAFGMLVEKHQAFAFSLSFRMTGDRADAEDIVQEAFVRLWKNLGRYRPEIRLTTWLYKIVANLCIDLLKSKRYRHRRNGVQVGEELALADPSTPEEAMQHGELLQIVRRMAETLTPKQQAVFVLRDLEGLPVQEVCQALAMTPGKVKSNLYHARSKMSAWLRVYYREKEQKNIDL